MSDIDRLYEAAFDGTERDAEAVRSGLTGREADEFQALLTLKSDLRALRDVPECQLTTDHLRQAILNQRHVPATKSWPRFLTWTSMAAAAGLMVFAVAKFGTSGPAASSPPIVSMNGHSAPTFTDDPSSETTVDTFVPDVLTAPTTEVATVDPATSREDTVRRRPTRRAFDSRAVQPPVAAKTAPAAMAAGTGGASVESGYAADAAVASGPSLADATERHIDTVVVVSDYSNPETGAADAREVSRPTDVVFGG